MTGFLTAHSDAAIALISAAFGAVLGFFGSLGVWWIDRLRQRRMARMQVVINLRRWMEESLSQINDILTYEGSGGAGGTIHSKVPNFRFENSLEVIALLEKSMAKKIFELIHEKDNANAEVESDIEYQDEDVALNTFRGRSAQVWLAALEIYDEISARIRWSERAFSDENKATMQEEDARLQKLERDRAEFNTKMFKLDR
jgi:hypothetical protein